MGVNHQSVANWVNAHAAQLPPAPEPKQVETIEMDELHTFIEDKKNKAYIITLVDRATPCILGWEVWRFVSDEVLQETLDELPPARWYYSDEMPAYGDLAYGTGSHFAMPNKSQTYSVEDDNAELRHYLARLARRSCCFSRSLQALAYAVRLFVFVWNQR